VPVWQQIAGIIRARIEGGQYPPGTPIPSIERIRQETGCAVKTIQRAVRSLTAEGLIEIVDGKGTFVRRPQ
jgi:GntR family transcriptional regulator